MRARVFIDVERRRRVDSLDERRDVLWHAILHDSVQDTSRRSMVVAFIRGREHLVRFRDRNGDHDPI